MLASRTPFTYHRKLVRLLSGSLALATNVWVSPVGTDTSSCEGEKRVAVGASFVVVVLGTRTVQATESDAPSASVNTTLTTVVVPGSEKVCVKRLVAGPVSERGPVNLDWPFTKNSNFARLSSGSEAVASKVSLEPTLRVSDVEGGEKPVIDGGLFERDSSSMTVNVAAGPNAIRLSRSEGLVRLTDTTDEPLAALSSRV